MNTPKYKMSPHHKFLLHRLLRNGLSAYLDVQTQVTGGYYDFSGGVSVKYILLLFLPWQVQYGNIIEPFFDKWDPCKVSGLSLRKSILIVRPKYPENRKDDTDFMPAKETALKLFSGINLQ